MAASALLAAAALPAAAVTTQSPGGLYEVDREGFVRSANHRWCQLAGRTQEEMIGSYWPDLVHPDDCDIAIDLLAAYREAGAEVTFEVNLSGRSIGDPALLELIENRLVATGVSPSWLIFEITETSAVANIPQARAFGERLSELGCRFALDDFGAGFGSFYYLKHLPFDYRQDRRRVRAQLRDQSDRSADRGERRRYRPRPVQADDRRVRRRRGHAPDPRPLGVDYAQGYHTGRPAPLEELIRLPDRAKAPV